jgi:outer membrane immunogenic protein
MKKVLLASVAAAALCSASALASDMPVRAPVYKVAPASVFSWTGCYLGGHTGYGWGKDTNSYGTVIDGGGVDFAPEAGPYNHNTSGGLVGGQLGCNYQVPSTNWVVGLEGEMWWSGMKGSLTTPEDPSDGPGFGGGFTKFQSQNRWDADIALRLGFAMNQSLPYAKVGVAWGNFRYTEWHDDFPTTHACPGYPATPCSASFTDTRPGLLLGVGWEFAWLPTHPTWTFKVEYNYINYGSHTIPYPSTSNPVALQSFPVHDTKNIIKVGFNFLN